MKQNLQSKKLDDQKHDFDIEFQNRMERERENGGGKIIHRTRTSPVNGNSIGLVQYDFRSNVIRCATKCPCRFASNDSLLAHTEIS